MNYIALIYKDNHSDYGIMFPDFTGCVSAAPTLEEAKQEARNALLGHIGVMKEVGEILPSPSSLDDIMAQKEHKDAVAFLVEAPSNRSVRVNVSFTEDVLELIDRRAHRCHLTRSAFLAEAAQEFKAQSNHNLEKG